MSKPQCDKTATGEQICVTYGGHHIKVYVEGKPHKLGYEICAAL
jgi:hypothetical protein